MKKLLLVLAFVFLPSAAFAQCNGIFNGGNVCGTPAGSPAIPGPLPLATFALGPAGSVGQIQTNNGSGGLSALSPVGIPQNIQNAQTGNYTISTTDCGKLILTSGGFNTIAVPAASGFAANCIITVKNNETYTGSSGRGKLLSGFPSDQSTILWPLQTVQITNQSSAWVTSYNPGIWTIPTGVTFHVDPTNGSNSNDGLAATSGAVATAQQAWAYAVHQLNVNGTTPIITMACSQTHTVNLQMAGIPLGSNLVQLSPDGNCGFTWYNSGSCIIISDLAELDLNLTYYGAGGTAIFECDINNAVSRGQIYLHNEVVLDIEGTPQWQPGGSNDNFLFCDGPCEYTIANGIAQSGGGTGNYVIYMNEGGKGTQSGAISGTGTFNGVYYLFGPTMLILGTANSMSGTVGTSKVYGHATLVNNGITPYGGVTVGASGVNCSSLTSTC
jgi:hypothetical protein